MCAAGQPSRAGSIGRTSRFRLRLLLASSSVAALLIGGGAPPAWAGCSASPTNSGSISCIDIANTSVSGNVVNAATGIITATGNVAPTRTGITIDNATIGGAIINAGQITSGTSGFGILVTNNATVSGGISNSGTIFASVHGILVGGTATPAATVTFSSFGGGISNSGTIAGYNGIVVGGHASGIFGTYGTTLEGSFTLSNFSGGISNSGLIEAVQHGILVGGVATGVITGFTGSTAIAGGSVSLVSFLGNISNSGTIETELGHGIFVGGFAQSGGSVTIGNFTGNIVNSGRIFAAQIGIFVGGTAVSASSVTISTFSGGITNNGLIVAGGSGIGVGGEVEGSGGSVTIGNFIGNIVNSSTIFAADGHGIAVGGGATGVEVSVTVSNFDGGITNTGKITAGANGIAVGGAAIGSDASVTVSTFSGSISNNGLISAAGHGILVGGSASGGSSLTIGTFGGGITNSGTIIAGIGTRFPGDGIAVGGFAGGGFDTSGGVFTSSLSLSSFGGNISNAGTILAQGTGIFVGGFAGTYSGTALPGNVTISDFSGSIVNSGTISVHGAGIVVGGSAISNSSVMISTFGGGITNTGTIIAGGIGIGVGGKATSNSSVTILTFGGGITNTGSITVRRGVGILVGGSPSVTTVQIATFQGNISNSGEIVARTGIVIGTGVTFAPGSAIVNTGIIDGRGGTAINATAATTPVTIDILGGTISGNIIGAAGAYPYTGRGATSDDIVNFMLGSGSFAYANTISAVQAVNIVSGTLFDSGSITAAGVTVDSGGTLAPGLPNTIGILNITGNLTFNSGSAYEIMLAAPGSVSNTSVIGATTINGGIVEVRPLQFGHYNAGTYTILTASSVTLNTPFGGPTFLAPFAYTGSATLSYPTDQVDLDLGAGYALLVAPPGANQNQQNIANGIDNAILAGDTVPQQFQNLGNLAGSALLNALTHIDGEDATGAETSAFELMNAFLNLLLDPLSDGGGPGGAAGGTLGFAPEQLALPPDIAEAYAAVLKAPPPVSYAQHWTAWGSAFGGGGITDGNATIGSNNVTASTYGFAGGLDYHVDPATLYGFALSGGGTNWTLAQGLGNGRSDAFQGGVYGKHYFGAAYVSGALAFANNWFTTDRTALGDELTAKFEGQSYAARFETGYRDGLPVSADNIIAGITPYAAVQAQWFHTPAYSETDLTGGGLGLTYNAMNANDTRSELGARFDDLTTFDAMPLILRGRLAWAHDWASNPALDAVFQALPGSNFVVNGAAPPSNSALTTVGAEFHITARWSALAEFDGDFAPRSQTYAGTGTLRYSW